MRDAIATGLGLVLVLSCACGADQPNPAETAQTAQTADEPSIEPEAPADNAARELQAEPLTCADTWCQFSRFPPQAKLELLAADGTQVWILDKSGVVARWDGGPDDAPERWSWWQLDGSVLDLWAGDGIAMVVGEQGFAARFEAGVWTTIKTGVTSDLWAVDGVPGGPVWMLGGGGALLRLDQHKLTKLELPPATSTRFVLEAVAADELWLVSDSAWQLSGGTWREHPFPPPPEDHTHSVQSIDSTGPDNIWALNGRYVYHWNGKTWTRADVKLDSLDDIDVWSRDDVIVHDGWEYTRWDGRTWTTRFDNDGRVLDRLADGRIVSGDHTLLIYDWKTSRWAHRGAGLDVRDVWIGQTTAWLVGGENGRDRALSIARYDGKLWQRWTLDAELATEVSGFGDDAWVLSESGDVFHLVDGEWQRESTGLRNPVHLRVVSKDEAWALDYHRGTIVRRVGGSWKVLEDERQPAAPVRSLRAAPDGTLMMLTAPTLLQPEDTPDAPWRWNGSHFEPMDPLDFSGLLLPLARDQAVAYTSDRVARWDGSRWTELTSLPPEAGKIRRMEAVGVRVIALTENGLFDLDTGAALPAPPVQPKYLFGNTAGTLWVASESFELAFTTP